MVSQTCKLHADFYDFRRNVRLARISLVGNVFGDSLAFAVNLANLLIARQLRVLAVDLDQPLKGAQVLIYPI